MTAAIACPLCERPSPRAALREALWAEPAVELRLARDHPWWQREQGACPACVQETVLEVLGERGEAAFLDEVQRAWPLDAEAAFGALPTPLRLRADPRFTGRGVTIALVDSGFYPHPDLLEPRPRIRAWVDASTTPVAVAPLGPGRLPRWPGWDAGASSQWHGLMTSVVAAGSGWLSRGLYRGLAPDAELVLIQVRDREGRITNDSIARALWWLERSGPSYGVRVVNLSLGGDPVEPLRGNVVDEAVGALVSMGMVVTAAAGNDGVRRLVPPGTAPDAITVGGLDDHNVLDEAERALWHGNYGADAEGAAKPEVVAPSLWVVAPVLPGTRVAEEAASLFAARARGDRSVDAAIAERKLVTPHYQHVEGTSFAAPVVAAIAACMLEARPGLRPADVSRLLQQSAHPVPGAPRERQGAGAVNASRAVGLALSGR